MSADPETLRASAAELRAIAEDAHKLAESTHDLRKRATAVARNHPSTPTLVAMASANYGLFQWAKEIHALADALVADANALDTPAPPEAAEFLEGL